MVTLPPWPASSGRSESACVLQPGMARPGPAPGPGQPTQIPGRFGPVALPGDIDHASDAGFTATSTRRGPYQTVT